MERILHGTLFGEAVVNAAVAVLLADDRGYYVAANDSACALTGYSRVELTAFQAGELSGDEASRRIYRSWTSGRKLEGRKLVRRRDGALLSCRYRAIPTTVAGLPYFAVLLWALN